MELETLELVRRAFKAAAWRASLLLNPSDIELLVRPTVFSLHIRKDVAAKNKIAVPKVALPLGIAEAATSALDFRSLLRLDDIEPVFHLPDLLMAQLDVFLFAVDQRRIEGACAMIGRTAFIFVSATTDADRLYTCARQLGYLLTKSARGTTDIMAIIEPARNSGRSPTGLYERFADVFAMELLIPTHGLGIALQQIRKLLKVSNAAVGDVELLYLSRIFGVPFLAIARRCERAQLLPRGGAAALHKFLVDNFGGPEARAKDLSLPARPPVYIAPVPMSIILATAKQIRKGEISLEHASNELGRSAAYLARAFNLASSSN